MSKRKNVVEFDEADKEGNRRGFVRRLLENLLWIGMLPVLVIAVDREIEIKAATRYSKHCKRQRSAYSSSWIAHGRPKDELI